MVGRGVSCPEDAVEYPGMFVDVVPYAKESRLCSELLQTAQHPRGRLGHRSVVEGQVDDPLSGVHLPNDVSQQRAGEPGDFQRVEVHRRGYSFRITNGYSDTNAPVSFS